MSRPIGVTIIAVLLLGFSLLTGYGVLTHPPGHRYHSLPYVAAALVVLALIAAEALWSLRSHAFLMFMLWGLCAMAAVALVRLNSAAGAHPARIIPPLVYTGLVFAAAALYLRRAV